MEKITLGKRVGKTVALAEKIAGIYADPSRPARVVFQGHDNEARRLKSFVSKKCKQLGIANPFGGGLPKKPFGVYQRFFKQKI
jgi:hypothetical protein